MTRFATFQREVQAENVRREPMTLNEALAAPDQRASYAYFEAKVAINDMLDADSQGWENLMVLLRSVAKQRHASVIEAELEEQRPHLNRAAKHQDISDQLVGAAAPEDRDIDERIITGGN